MKRRDFVKTGVCLGCAGVLGIGINTLCNNYMVNSKKISAKDFIYKNESELPTRIKLDVCNLCQLNCAACWMRRDEDKIKKEAGGFGYVSFATFKKFLDNNPLVREIEISNNGEIFLNPDLEDIIKYAYEKGIILTAGNGVNLNTFSEKMAEALVKYQVRYITVSIDGATPETYAIYRRGGDFNTVINNVKLINKYKKLYNSKYPELEYKFILFGHNQHEIEKAKALAKKLDMIMKFDINCVPEYSPLTDKEKVYARAGVNQVDTNLDNYLENFKQGKSDWFFCKELYVKPQFNWNGDLFGCCTPYLQTFGVNVFKDGLLKTLNNPRFVYAKMMLADFSVEGKYKIPCNGCFIYDFLREKDFPMKKEYMNTI